jgi:hypothetical protein
VNLDAGRLTAILFPGQADVVMVMADIPKQIKRLVREWAGIAHDRDLRQALSNLRLQFDRWDRGEINACELNDLVHRFHQDTSREIWKRYSTTRLEPAVASAVAAGVLRQDELPVALVQHIASLIGFHEQELSASRPQPGNECIEVTAALALEPRGLPFADVQPSG